MDASAIIHKNEEIFSGALAFRIQSIQIFFWIRVQSEDFLCRVDYFSLNGNSESKEKVAGLSINMEKFGLVEM